MPPTIPRTWTRRLVRWLVAAVCCYLGVIVVLLFLENRLLFHPVRADKEWQPPPNPRVEDISLPAEGVTIHAWWCPPRDWEPARGAMLYCHGNAGNLSHRADAIADWQNERGEAVLIFDYPGYGRSEGKPSEAGCYAAAEAAHDWLIENQHVPPERLILLGRSLGAAVATHLAVERPHRALVLISPFTSVPDMAQTQFPWLPGRWLVRNRFDNLARIGDCRQPLFIAHGTDDGLVPFAQGESLFAAANEPKHLYPMTSMGHNARLGPEFYRRLRDFLASCRDL
jgi:fermentation-respiration switch protein FrsA (DUF1100 family)